jgi:hypothetical protein
MTLVDRNNLQGEVLGKTHLESATCNGDEKQCPCFERAKSRLEYSILSHRWGSNEIIFNEFKKLRSKLDEGGNIGGSGKQS